MEKQVEKVFVKLNQAWQKGDAVAVNDTTYKVKTADNLTFEIDKQSEYLEMQRSPAQRFALGEAKERLEGAYISFAKLPENVQDAIVRGEEYLHKSAYPKDGIIKESVKMVQMVYSPTSGSRLDVQIKRKEEVTLAQAKAYNHQFTQAEFDKMVNEGRFVSFEGRSSNGESFTKLAYYEPKLNDIRTKSALSSSTYLYGQQLTKEQADSLNQGKETKITIKATKKGPLTYMVSYSPRAERFITKSLEKAKVKDMETKEAITVSGEKKKKQPSNAISM
ncbi:hypothetical protein MTsPCn5_08790 [Croceitalea sp. MTPC5]|uniref:hypothetical protein n=1 Tax=Croceitalea sp. MTPC5 TaxID=3056565 RepID=UPI002B3D58EC|nr:hypothetical protein MTsPCn5_08790 [Croceitalea sp. MTPC5]